MAEAARNLTPSTNTGGSFSSAAPANDNAQAWNQTQRRDALQLRSNQLLDQRAANDNALSGAYDPEFGETGGGDFLSDASMPTDSSLGSDEKPILELKPQSYMQGPEANEEAQEIERQRAMLEAQRRFTEPGTAMPSEAQPPSPSERRRQSSPELRSEQPPASETKRALALRQGMGKDRQQAEEEQGGVAGQLATAARAERTMEDIRKVRQIYASLVKAIQAAFSAALLPIIMLIAALHLETLNILLLHINLPEPFGTALALIGINLSYDTRKGFGIYELVIVSITLLFDLILFLLFLQNIALMFTQIGMITGILSNIIPGVF